MRNTRRKGVSPVIATVILVAIAIVVSIAAAFWMTGLLGSFTSYERVQITASYATRSGDKYTVYLGMTNIGTANVTVTAILINDKPYTAYVGVSISITVDGGSPYTSLPVSFAPGQSFKLEINGNGFTTSAFRPGSTIKVSILTASGVTYDRTITLP